MSIEEDILLRLDEIRAHQIKEEATSMSIKENILRRLDEIRAHQIRYDQDRPLPGDQTPPPEPDPDPDLPFEPTPPAVSTAEVTEVTDTSATLNGTLTALGDYTSVDVLFQWRAVGDEIWEETAPQTRTTTGNFSAGITPLTPEKSYGRRAVVRYTKSDGVEEEVAGAILSFTADEAEPDPDPIPDPEGFNDIVAALSWVDQWRATGGGSFSGPSGTWQGSGQRFSGVTSMIVDDPFPALSTTGQFYVVAETAKYSLASFTVVAIVQRSALVAGTWRNVFSVDDPTGPGGYFLAIHSNGSPIFRVKDENGDFVDVMSTDVDIIGDVCCIRASIGPSGMVIQRNNGAKVINAALTEALGAGVVRKAVIGAHRSTGNNPFNGGIQFIGIATDELSDAQWAVIVATTKARIQWVPQITASGAVGQTVSRPTTGLLMASATPTLAVTTQPNNATVAVAGQNLELTFSALDEDVTGRYRATDQIGPSNDAVIVATGTPAPPPLDPEPDPDPGPAPTFNAAFGTISAPVITAAPYQGRFVGHCRPVQVNASNAMSTGSYGNRIIIPYTGTLVEWQFNLTSGGNNEGSKSQIDGNGLHPIDNTSWPYRMHAQEADENWEPTGPKLRTIDFVHFRAARNDGRSRQIQSLNLNSLSVLAGQRMLFWVTNQWNGDRSKNYVNYNLCNTHLEVVGLNPPRHRNLLYGDGQVFVRNNGNQNGHSMQPVYSDGPNNGAIAAMGLRYSDGREWGDMIHDGGYNSQGKTHEFRFQVGGSERIRQQIRIPNYWYRFKEVWIGCYRMSSDSAALNVAVSGPGISTINLSVPASTFSVGASTSVPHVMYRIPLPGNGFVAAPGSTYTVEISSSSQIYRFHANRRRFHPRAPSSASGIGTQDHNPLDGEWSSNNGSSWTPGGYNQNGQCMFAIGLFSDQNVATTQAGLP